MFNFSRFIFTSIALKWLIGLLLANSEKCGKSGVNRIFNHHLIYVRPVEFIFTLSFQGAASIPPLQC